MDEPLRVALLAMAWLVGWWLCARPRTLPSAGSDVPDVDVSVIVPARDEEDALPILLDGLASQHLVASEIIVVDDGSRDRTASIASLHGARVVPSEPVPEGWTGKAWALWQGANASRSELLVLLDADVEPTPALLGSVARAHATHGGLVSVQPFHRMRRWWERASAFFNLVAVMGVGVASPQWPRRRPVIAAFGPVIACSRDLFLAHGDVRGVRSAILEDVELARSVAAAGVPVSAYTGGRVVAFRMYDRPTRLVEGWAKNFASGARAVPPARLALVVAWVTACLLSGGWVLGAGLTAMIVFVAFAAQCFVQLRQLGNFGVVTAVLYPLLAVIFVAIFLFSLLVTLRGEVMWKGRRIRLRAG
jgi:4,4'-diaponeurosporenoate glycosyltransferase